MKKIASVGVILNSICVGMAVSDQPINGYKVAFFAMLTVICWRYAFDEEYVN